MPPASLARRIKFDAANPALYYERGSVQLEDKKVADAEKDFNEAIKIDPKLYKAHFRLGVVLQAEEKFREADAEYRKAIESNPRFVQAYLKLGNLYLDNDYDKEAAQVFQNAILANDSDGEAHQGLAEALQKQKQYEESVKEYKKAFELNAELYLAAYNIGHTYKLLGDKKQAKEWLQKFVTQYASRGGPELAKAAGDELYALDAP